MMKSYRIFCFILFMHRIWCNERGHFGCCPCRKACSVLACGLKLSSGVLVGFPRESLVAYTPFTPACRWIFLGMSWVHSQKKLNSGEGSDSEPRPSHWSALGSHGGKWLNLKQNPQLLFIVNMKTNISLNTVGISCKNMLPNKVLRSGYPKIEVTRNQWILFKV